jgi:ABC-type multidrug transport system ATPase subunit
MNKGRIIALDTPEAIRNAVKKGEFVDVVVQNLTEAQENTVRAISGVVAVTAEVQDAVLGQTRLRVRLDNVDVLPRLIDYFFKENIKLVNFKREEPTLEDAFIELTGVGITE